MFAILLTLFTQIIGIQEINPFSSDFFFVLFCFSAISKDDLVFNLNHRDCK